MVHLTPLDLCEVLATDQDAGTLEVDGVALGTPLWSVKAKTRVHHQIADWSAKATAKVRR